MFEQPDQSTIFGNKTNADIPLKSGENSTQQSGAGRSPLLRPTTLGKSSVQNRLGIRNINRRLEAMKTNYIHRRNFNRPSKNGSSIRTTQRTKFFVNRNESYRNSYAHHNSWPRKKKVNKNNLSLSPNNPATMNRKNLSEVTDITVQLMVPTEEINITKFKMELNPKYQFEIKRIQSIKKVNQVVEPLRITPNTTSLSLHKRFSLL